MLVTLWRGIREVWPPLNLGLQWGLRDGRSTKFWTDPWLDSGGFLLDCCTDPGTINTNDSVFEFVTPSGQWDFPKLESFLPNAWMKRVAGMTPPKNGRGPDIPTWGLENNGKYSVKSGYLLIAGQLTNSATERQRWRSIWMWQGPNRFRHFLWTVGHSRLMTNFERYRRHLALSVDCQTCLGFQEPVLHVLRDCPVASAL
ncbi:Putative ribonuclease H protein At1g65750 [Linum grandiflorum]